MQSQNKKKGEAGIGTTGRKRDMLVNLLCIPVRFLSRLKSRVSSHRTMTKKQDKNFLFKICELLATIGILGNTLILIIFQNTWTYEKLPILKFEPTPKSSYLTIIQHNPIFVIIYILCGLVLLMCAIYRLSKRIQGKEKS